MIHHTIETLIKTKIFDEIIVTTDSKKIQKISKNAGAKIYFKRPPGMYKTNNFRRASKKNDCRPL